MGKKKRMLEWQRTKIGKKNYGESFWYSKKRVILQPLL
jgi:hypothetical protein